MGQTRRFEAAPSTSALPPTPDILLSRNKRRSGPVTDIAPSGNPFLQGCSERLLSNDSIFDWSPREVRWPAGTFLNQIITRRYCARLAGSVQRGMLSYPPVAVEPGSALSLNQPERHSL